MTVNIGDKLSKLSKGRVLCESCGDLPAHRGDANASEGNTKSSCAFMWPMWKAKLHVACKKRAIRQLLIALKITKTKPKQIDSSWSTHL